MKPRTTALYAAVPLVMSLFAPPAIGAPGDALLVQGTLEWPRTLASEPMVIVRGEDGTLYYASVVSAQRRITGQMTAGSRIALLGVEGTRPQSVNAIALGNSDVAALALALSQGGAAATAAATPAVAETPAAATATAASAPPPATAASPQIAASAHAPAATQAPTAPHPPAPQPSAAPKAVVTAAPTATVPADAATLAGGPAAAAHAATTAPSATATTAAPAPTIVASATPVSSAWPSDSSAGHRWIEIQGVVQSVTGRTVVLEGDNGQIITVDASSLSPNFPDMVRPGALVSVFGLPVEQRFKAMGFIDADHPVAPHAPSTPLRR